HPYGGQKNDALTFKTDQTVGAGQAVSVTVRNRFNLRQKMTKINHATPIAWVHLGGRERFQ
ncbi:MAG: hypothetical protein O3B37_15125, partial [Proteobacteria bacterium]|nr:hypothetical protein [Pseudomonadota bacterium]